MREVFKKVVVEKTHDTYKKAMKEAGYSDATANLPKNVTGTKGWAMLMDEYLSNESLASKHKELLELTDANGRIDVQAVGKALDMAYKLRGSYAAEKNLNVNVNISSVLDELDV